MSTGPTAPSVRSLILIRGRIGKRDRAYPAYNNGAGHASSVSVHPDGTILINYDFLLGSSAQTGGYQTQDPVLIQ